MRRTCCALLSAFVIGLALVSTAPTPATAAGASRAKPAERPCGAGNRARCGHVTVPLDRSGRVPGTLRIGYERYPRTDRSRPALETVVAVEGGPGYPTTESRSYYLPLFRPMMARHDLLLVDLRGTGTSANLRCEPLQHIGYPYDGWAEAVGKCGRQLGDASNLYGTAHAADDLADVLTALGLPQVDLYGDSYGTFFSQTFAIRHPGRLRTLVLDAAYPVEGTDPWWRDTAHAAAAGYRIVCRRDPGCAARAGDPVQRVARLARSLAEHPITGVAPDADGHLREVTITPGVLIAIYDSAGYAFDPYRELDAAVRAALRPHPDDLPLLRLARENLYYGAGGPLKYYTQGLASAVGCTDYPQLYDMSAPPRVRPAQFADAVRFLRRSDPKAFAPFTIHQWITSPDEDFDSCLRWPVPAHPHPLLPPGHTYPVVPTLVLNGDLDSVTSSEGARTVAASFPNATFVRVHNMVHVSAVGDSTGCAAGIVVRFMRTLSAGDTTCAKDYPPVEAVETFARRAAGIPGAPNDRVALVAANTVADVMARWDNMGGSSGVGLRGGTFTATGGAVRHWRLRGVRWVRDVGVSGSVTRDVEHGNVHAVVRLSGTGLAHWRLDLRWNDLQRPTDARVIGHLGARSFRIVVAAP